MKNKYEFDKSIGHDDYFRNLETGNLIVLNNNSDNGNKGTERYYEVFGINEDGTPNKDKTILEFHTWEIENDGEIDKILNERL